jgi:hypothetical protein
MKMKSLFFALAILALLSGCKDDDKNGETYSDLTVEDHKANLEQSGLRVADQMDAMSDLKSVNVIADFSDLMDAISDSEYALAGVLQPVLTLNNGASAAFDLKATTTDRSVLSQLFDGEAGIYTYNPVYNTWDEKTSDSEITYHFPTEGSPENNATLSLTNFNFITTNNPDVSGVSEELPTSFDLELAVDGESLITFKFNASYDGDGIPTSVSESWTFEGFNLTTSVSRSSSSVEVDQSFKYQDENIISSHFSSAGSFNYDDVKEGVDDVANQDVLNSANAWLAIDNLKIEGKVDWKGFANGMSKISGVENDQQLMEKQAKIMNDNMSLKLKYNDSNERIAEGEVYAKTEEDVYYNEMGWNIGFRLKFSDGSSYDDSFFGENDFVDLIDSFEDMVEDAEENYDVTIE